MRPDLPQKDGRRKPPIVETMKEEARCFSNPFTVVINAALRSALSQFYLSENVTLWNLYASSQPPIREKESSGQHLTNRRTA
jgi:hypothetical protein